MNGNNEMAYKESFQQQLLMLLINKYEKSKSFTSGEPSKQKPQIVMKRSPFLKDYVDEMDFRKKDWINEVIGKLCEEEIVSITWEKFREGKQIAKVYLEPDALTKAYQLLDLEPKDKKMARLRDMLLRLENHSWD